MEMRSSVNIPLDNSEKQDKRNQRSERGFGIRVDKWNVTTSKLHP